MEWLIGTQSTYFYLNRTGIEEGHIVNSIPVTASYHWMVDDRPATVVAADTYTYTASSQVA